MRLARQLAPEEPETGPWQAKRLTAADQKVRERRASSSPCSLSPGPLMPVRSFSAIRQAK